MSISVTGQEAWFNEDVRVYGCLYANTSCGVIFTSSNGTQYKIVATDDGIQFLPVKSDSGSQSTLNVQNLNITGDTTLTGDITANSFIKNGGTSNQFLKADGSVDSTNYGSQKLSIIPKTSAYILAIGDVGAVISITTGGVTVPSGVFTAGDTVLIYNNSSSSQTITQGASTTLRLPGTADTGNRTLQQRGLATVLCIANNEFLITGSGLL